LNLDTENNKFSIWLDNDHSDGALIFGDDSDYRGEQAPLRMMGVTKNWEVPIESLFLLDSQYAFTGKAIFDINSDFVGLPDNIYNQLMMDLKNRWNFACDYQIYQPNCSYTKNISNLPHLVIMPTEGNNPITLTPDLYLRRLDNNLYKLMFVSLINKPIFGNQVFVTLTYANNIILGTPFFRHYYTVFNYQDPSNPEIDFYLPVASNPNVNEGGLSTWAILGIVLGALLLLGIIIGSIYAFKKSRDRKRQESLVNPDTRVNYVAYNQ